MNQGAKALPGAEEADVNGAGGGAENAGERVAIDLFEVVKLKDEALCCRERGQSQFNKLASGFEVSRDGHFVAVNPLSKISQFVVMRRLRRALMPTLRVTVVSQRTRSACVGSMGSCLIRRRKTSCVRSSPSAL